MSAEPIGLFGVALDHALSVTWLLGVIVYLFLTLSTAAFDFLSPTIGHLSAKTGLPDEIIGVTFLAFGNASADIAAAYSAISSNSPVLAISSILGAAMFVSSVGAGTVGIVGGPFHVSRSQLLRDIIFLLIATGLLLITIADGVITCYESIVLLLVYAAYATVVVNYHRFDFDAGKNSTERSVPESPEIPANSTNPISHIDVPAALTHRSSIYSAIEPHSSMFSTPASRRNSLSEVDRCMSPRSLPDQIAIQAVPSLVVDEPPCDQLNSPQPPTMFNPPAPSTGSTRGIPPTLTVDTSFVHDSLNPLSTPSISPMPREDTPVVPFDSSENLSLSSDNDITSGPMSVIIPHIFPFFVQRQEKTWLAKSMGFLIAPALLLLTVTIPIAETNLDQPLLLMHAFACPPAFFMLVTSHSPKLMLVSVAVSGILAGIAYKAPHMIPNICITLVGFVMSVSWVMFFAESLIKLVKLLGAKLGWSEAAVGLVVVSLGNSAGDIVANLALVKNSYPNIALGASFGSPLLNMLLGIGGSSLIVMVSQRKKSIELSTSTAILSTGLLLMATLGLYAAMMSANGWQMTRNIGIVGIVLWAVSWFTAVYFTDS